MTPPPTRSTPKKTGARKASKSPKPSRAPKALEPEVLPSEDEEKDEGKDEDDEKDGEEEADESEEAEEGAIAAEAEGASRLPAIRNAGLPAEVADKELAAVGRAISPGDPLKRYLDEARRYPLLDPEEEFRLANRLREEGDMDAARRLVQANLRLVVKIALEYRSMYSNVLDLIQEGNIGLMKAVSKFDPTKGARLGYYSSWWIRSYILKYLLDNFRLVKIGTTQAQKKLFYHLMREKERLEAQGMLAGPKLLAERLNVREKDVVEMEQRLSSRGAEMSLDAPVGQGEEGGSPAHRDFIADSRIEAADEALARSQLLELLKEKLPAFEEGLNEKERRILKERLLAEEPKTLQEVADNYGLTRERARQIEAKVIAKLREFLGRAVED